MNPAAEERAHGEHDGTRREFEADRSDDTCHAAVL